MRALFYHPGGRWCGEARAFVAAARGLAGRGWPVRLGTPAGSPAHAHAERAGVPVAALDADDGFLGAVNDLTRVLRDHRADVVYAHGERGQSVAATAVWRAGRGAVVRRVPAAAAPAWGGAGVRAALRTAPTGVLCAWPEQAEAVPPRARPATVVADLGVPLAGGTEPGAGHAAAPPAEPGAARLVCVYDPAAQLRAATVLRAVAMLAPRHPDLRVVLAGPGAADEGLRMHAAALGIHQRVRVYDPARDAVPRDPALGDLFADGADAHDPASTAAGGASAHAELAGAVAAWVLAEGDDGAFGALDAMAAGVPVLAERGSTAARYVADAITGLHLAPGDVPGTAAALAQLLADDETRHGMGAAGRARVARTYTEAAMLDGFARAADLAGAGARAGARAGAAPA